MKRNQHSSRTLRQQRKLARGLKRGVSKYAAKVASRVDMSSSLLEAVTPRPLEVK